MSHVSYKIFTKFLNLHLKAIGCPGGGITRSVVLDAIKVAKSKRTGRSPVSSKILTSYLADYFMSKGYSSKVVTNQLIPRTLVKTIIRYSLVQGKPKPKLTLEKT